MPEGTDKATPEPTQPLDAYSELPINKGQDIGFEIFLSKLREILRSNNGAPALNLDFPLKDEEELKRS